MELIIEFGNSEARKSTLLVLSQARVIRKDANLHKRDTNYTLYVRNSTRISNEQWKIEIGSNKEDNDDFIIEHEGCLSRPEMNLIPI